MQSLKTAILFFLGTIFLVGALVTFNKYPSASAIWAPLGLLSALSLILGVLLSKKLYSVLSSSGPEDSFGEPRENHSNRNTSYEKE